jgi:hypothetical protein
MNTLSDLSQLRDHAAHIAGIDEVRRELLSSGSKRTIVVSQHLLSETAGYENSVRRPFFEADMGFLNSIPNLMVVKGQGELMNLEVNAFLTRQTLAPFIDAHFPIDYDDPEWKRLFLGEREWVKSAKKDFIQFERESRTRIDRSYPNREERSRRLAEAWSADSHGTVERFVRHQMGLARTRLGLPDDEAAWPRPQQLPTFWCNWGYLVTRSILLELPDPPTRKPSDVIDWLHFQSAPHADEFVSSDRDLLRIALAVPGPTPEILSLEEWVARVRGE